jgi:hypothetical protein
MRSDVFLRHMKVHWKEISDAMGEQQLATCCANKSPILYHRKDGNTQWAFCACCNKGEWKTITKARAFKDTHKYTCSSSFDSVRYMFDHSIPKPIQTRTSKPKEINESLETAEDGTVVKTVTVTKIVEKESPVSEDSFLAALRSKFPEILTNVERDENYKKALEEDPDLEDSIDEFGDDNLADHDTFGKALSAIHNSYNTKCCMLNASSGKMLKLNEQLQKAKKDAEVANDSLEKLKYVAEQREREAETLRNQLIAMNNKIMHMQALQSEKDNLYAKHGYDTTDNANDIANHINSFS